MIQHLDILDGGTLDYDEAFYPQDQADRLFEQLSTATPWKQERGRMGPFPRLTAWYADPGLIYTYSGVTHEVLSWTPALLDMRQRVETVASTCFNSLLLNFYRDGRDSMGYHSDAEPELGTNPIIGSVSLGGVRTFILRHLLTGEKHTFLLGHGSLLVMGGTSQHHWRHGVPKTKKSVLPRINLTFRKIVTPARDGI